MPLKKISNVLIKCLPTHPLRQAARRRFLSTRRVICNDMAFDVEPSEFWYHFDSGKWEPETFAFYQKYATPEKDVIDIGGWIGPTMLLAYAFNARSVHVVEADPANFQILKKNCRRNYLEDRVHLYPLCLSDRTGQIVTFGRSSKKKGTSTKRIGHGYTKVRTTSMLEFIQSMKLREASIVKMDIEGAEQDAADTLDYIAGFPGVVMLFSIHVHLWRNPGQTSAMLLEKFKNYEVYAEDETPLSLSDVASRLEQGGGFCLILKTRP